MAIIAFWSNEEKETGQTMSMVALSTYMAIEHNYRILNISTAFNDQTLEKSYWDLRREERLINNIAQNRNQVGIDTGIEGLIKVINSNKTSSNIVSDYTKVIFKDRLDILASPKTKIYEDYQRVAQKFPDVLQVAARNYDLVFVDVSKKMPKEQEKQILELADVIIANITQKLETIEDFMELKQTNDFFKKNNVLINVGRYDKYSKYNIKNISRYMKEKDIHVTVYNTLFFDACSEAGVAELLLRLRRIDEEDRNALFIAEVGRLARDLIYKIQELQLKI